MNLYRWLYSRIGGRPWTFIFRDFYHQYEWFIYVGCVVGGFYLARVFGERDFWVAIGIWSLGYIFGHFHWGKRYIEGQGTNPPSYDSEEEYHA